ncbi:unnamed protein product [Sphagnum troendelagicum]|uniref:Uncharacterized protein n=1 Tax=Sphagnum troendelagicum TaxID=128251 RepID=A0ABP0TV16_9BRYO
MIRMVQDSGIVGLAGMVFNCSMFSQNPGQPPPLENQVTFELFTVNVQHCNFISILPMLDLSDSKIKHSLEGKRCSPRVLEITRFQYFRNSVLQFWR